MKQDVLENANDNTEQIFFHRIAEMSSTLARLNNLPGYDPFQEPVPFRKNLTLLLVDKLQTFKYSIKSRVMVFKLILLTLLSMTKSN